MSLEKLVEPVRVDCGAVTESGLLVTELVLMETPQTKKTGPFLRKIGPELTLLYRLLPYCWRSFRMADGAALACARAAMVDCSKVWAWVRLAAAVATSASRMEDSADEKLVIWELARDVA